MLNLKYTGENASWLSLTCPLIFPSSPPQLNPGAVLNHKYTGENAVRAAGLPYCVLRPTGLTNESEPGEFLLEASQGEAMAARLFGLDGLS